MEVKPKLSKEEKLARRRKATREHYLKNKEKYNKRSLEHYHNNKQDYLDRAAQWRKNNPDKVNQLNKNWRDKNPDKVKGIKLKQRYGISFEEFNIMLENQNYSCAICFKEADLVVDHNHSTAKVRALLCHQCNHGLGLFFESLTNLENAIRYLKEHN
jgi:hypothetical protein